jgi:hypothetical protein
MSDTVSTKNLDHLGIVAGVCQQIDLIKQIDAQNARVERGFRFLKASLFLPTVCF